MAAPSPSSSEKGSGGRTNKSSTAKKRSTDTVESVDGSKKSGIQKESKGRSGSKGGSGGKRGGGSGAPPSGGSPAPSGGSGAAPPTNASPSTPNSSAKSGGSTKVSGASSPRSGGGGRLRNLMSLFNKVPTSNGSSTPKGSSGSSLGAGLGGVVFAATVVNLALDGVELANKHRDRSLPEAIELEMKEALDRRGRNALGAGLVVYDGLIRYTVGIDIQAMVEEKDIIGQLLPHMGVVGKALLAARPGEENVDIDRVRSARPSAPQRPEVSPGKDSVANVDRGLDAVPEAAGFEDEGHGMEDQGVEVVRRSEAEGVGKDNKGHGNGSTGTYTVTDGPLTATYVPDGGGEQKSEESKDASRSLQFSLEVSSENSDSGTDKQGCSSSCDPGNSMPDPTGDGGGDGDPGGCAGRCSGRDRLYSDLTLNAESGLVQTVGDLIHLLSVDNRVRVLDWMASWDSGSGVRAVVTGDRSARLLNVLQGLFVGTSGGEFQAGNGIRSKVVGLAKLVANWDENGSGTGPRDGGGTGGLPDGGAGRVANRSGDDGYEGSKPSVPWGSGPSRHVKVKGVFTGTGISTSRSGRDTVTTVRQGIDQIPASPAPGSQKIAGGRIPEAVGNSNTVTKVQGPATRLSTQNATKVQSPASRLNYGQ